MRTFRATATAIVSKVLASRAARALGYLAEDAIVTLGLLGTLTVFHFSMRYTAARPDFLATFTTIHQYVCLAAYSLWAFKSLLRLAKL